MGGAVSAGEDNDELIDKLVEAEYIKTPQLEQIFRAVDRGYYYLEGCKETAYRDLAWKHGNIHLSAPCIYSEVMESLKLGPGMSFLNLGSGTGYLSTMAGLVLGTFGVNHGIELHSEVVDYARAKLEEFQSTSPALDKYEFCPPSFVVGNCLQLDSSSPQYDRVYCGASCPSEHENYIKNLVRVGGILVMPLNDHLLQVTRTGELTYDVKNVLPVSFASLVVPDPSKTRTFVKLPEKHPLSLKEICRSLIRVLLRANAERENPSLKNKKKSVPKRRKSKRRIRKVVIPVFEGGRPATLEHQSHDEASDAADDNLVPPEPNMFEFSSQTQPKMKKTTHCTMYEDHVVFEKNNALSIGLKPLDSDEDRPNLSNNNIDGGYTPERDATNKTRSDCSVSQTVMSNSGNTSSNIVTLDDFDKAKGYGYNENLKDGADEDKNVSNSDEEMISHINVIHGQRSSSLDIITYVSSNNSSRKESQTDSDGSRRGSLAKASDSGRDSGSQEDTPCSSLQQGRHLTEKLSQEKKQNTHPDLHAEKESSDHEDMDVEGQDFEIMNSDKEGCDSSEENQDGVSRPKCPRSGKREAEMDESDIRCSYPRVGNVDSGIDNISDDSVPDECSLEPSSSVDKDSADASSSVPGQSSYLKRAAEGPAHGLHTPRLPSICCTKAVVFKRIAYSDVDSDDLAEFDSDSGKESFPKDYEASREKSDLSCYTFYMKQKISQLPLPQFLKMYLNFSKPL